MGQSIEESLEYQLEVALQRARKAEDLEARNSAIARGIIANKDSEIRALEAQLEQLQHGDKDSSETIEEEGTKPQLSWRPFPLELLPDVVQDYVRAHAAAKNCDPAFIATPALGTLAAALGNSYSIEIKKS